MALTLTRDTPPPTALAAKAWKCVHCQRTLGHIVNGVLHEAGGDKSSLPVVRRCKCGRRNVKLAA